MSVLVTGGSGFIGRVLVQRLKASGAQVTGTHRRSVPPDIPGVTWVRMERMDSQEQWRPLLEGIDTVIHLAALAHQTGPAGVGRWDEFHRINVAGTSALAQACGAKGVRRLIFLSSVAAVCTSSDAPVDERTEPNPVDDYGRSKRLAEQQIEVQLRGQRTDWCILRPPLIYGPGNPGNMERLMGLIARGLPIPFGSIRNRRSFMYVDNLADALATATRHPSEIHSAFMVSDGSDFSTPELTRMLAAATGCPVNMWRVPIPMLRGLALGGDLAAAALGRSIGLDTYSLKRLTGSLVVDSRAFRRVFSWEPPTSPADAIRATSAARAH